MSNPFLPIAERFCVVFADRDRLLWAYIPVLSGCFPLRSPQFREHFFTTSHAELNLLPTSQQFAAILSFLAGRARANSHSALFPTSLPRRADEHFSSTLPDRLRLHLQNSRDQFV